jgi:hypothetical protein
LTAFRNALAPFLAGLGLLAATSLPASSREIAAVEVGDWRMSANTSDENGRFLYCETVRASPDGVLFSFLISTQVYLILWDPDWNITRAEVATTVEVDNRARFTMTGEVIGNNAVSIAFEAEAATYQHFMYGNRLRVGFSGRTYEVSLSGSYQALTRLVECVEQYVDYQEEPTGRRSGGDAVASATPPPPTDEERIAYRLEATELVTNVLNRAGINGFRLLGDSAMRERFGQPDALWTSGAVYGSVNIIDTMNDYSIDDVAAASLLGIDDCPVGMSFASRRERLEDLPLVRIALQCEARDGMSLFMFTVLPRPKGGYFRLGFAMLGTIDGDQDSLAAAVDGIEATAIELIAGSGATIDNPGGFTPL